MGFSTEGSDEFATEVVGEDKDDVRAVRGEGQLREPEEDEESVRGAE